MESHLPSDVTADAACDTGPLLQRWVATRYETSENDSGIQSLGKGVQDMHIDITKFDNKRRGKKFRDTEETPKRQCYDSGIGDDSLKAAVSLDSRHGDLGIGRGAFSSHEGSYLINEDNTGPESRLDVVFESKIKEKANENDFAVLFARNAEGDTPLHIFIIHELLKATLCIIGFAISPCQLDTVNDMQQSPLILAAMTRQARVVRALLMAGADLLLADRHGDTAVHIASRNGDLQTLKALTTPVSLNEAKDGKYVEKERRIEQAVNAKNYDGYTPIHLATLEGHRDILTHLVEVVGADVDEMEGKAGLRPIHLSVANEDRETIKHLVEECLVDIDATTFYGLSPIELANERRLYDVVVYLANFGAYRTDIEVPEFMEQDGESDDEIEFADLQINGKSVYK